MRNRFGEQVFWNDRWEQSISRDNTSMHPLHREYFDCSSVYAYSASQKWRRMKDFKKQPGEWAPIEEKRIFSLEPEEMEPEMEHRDIRTLNHRLSTVGGIEKQGCQSPSRKTFCLLTAVPEKRVSRFGMTMTGSMSVPSLTM
jgi:hypothetical protein